LSSDDEEHLTPKDVAATTARRSDCAVRFLTAATLDSNLLPESPKTWRRINPNLYDYHSDPMEISSTFSLPDITE